MPDSDWMPNTYKLMAEGGNRTSIVDSLYPRTKKPVFRKGWLLMGKNEHGEPFYLRMGKDPFRTIVLGKTRSSGKTMLVRRIWDMAYRSGYSSVCLTDISDEYKSSNEPCASHLRKFLDENDIPSPTPTKTYRAVFYSEYLREELPSGNSPFAIAYSEISFSDLKEALGFIGQKYEQHAKIVENFYSNRTIKTLGQLRQAIADAPHDKVRSFMKPTILSRIDSLIRYKVFTDEPIGDFIKDIRDGYNIAFNVKNYEKIGRNEDSVAAPQLYFKIILWKIKDARTKLHGHDSLSKPVIVIIEEAVDFIEGDPLRELVTAVNQWAKFGIYFIFISQQLEVFLRKALDIFKQCKYLFAPGNLPWDDKRAILEALSIHSQTASDKHYYIMEQSKYMAMAKGRRLWTLSDKDEGDPRKRYEFFFSYPSISGHMESRN